MRDFRERKAQAQRRSLDVLPIRARPAFAPHGKERKCDGCQACCTVVAIEGKPKYTRCEHQCDAGCAVYAVKPEECTTYKCAYREGALTGGAEMRPDVLGLIVDYRYLIGRGGPMEEAVVTVWEVWSGAAETDDAWALLSSLADLKENLCLVPYDAPDVTPGVSKNIRLFTRRSSVEVTGVFNGPYPRLRFQSVLRQFRRGE